MGSLRRLTEFSAAWQDGDDGLLRAAIEQVVRAGHAVVRLEAELRDPRVVLGVLAEVDLLRRLFPGHLRGVERLRLLPEVPQVRLEVLELRLAVKRLAVPGQNGVEVELLQRVQRR